MASSWDHRAPSADPSGGTWHLYVVCLCACAWCVREWWQQRTNRDYMINVVRDPSLGLSVRTGINLWTLLSLLLTATPFRVSSSNCHWQLRDLHLYQKELWICILKPRVFFGCPLKLKRFAFILLSWRFVEGFSHVFWWILPELEN